METRANFLARRIEECRKLIEDGYKGTIDIHEIKRSAEVELARINEAVKGTVQLDEEHQARINKRNVNV